MKASTEDSRYGMITENGESEEENVDMEDGEGEWVGLSEDASD